jgi:hypothetical protein
MEAKDLRIGNWYLGDCTEGKFHQITANEILDFNDDPLDDYYKPIQLTEDWLFKFGFKKNQRDIRFKRLGSIVLKSTEKGFKFNYGESITYIHFVHQLQNLNFALNGNELTLKN